VNKELREDPQPDDDNYNSRTVQECLHSRRAAYKSHTSMQQLI